MVESSCDPCLWRIIIATKRRINLHQWRKSTRFRRGCTLVDNKTRNHEPRKTRSSLKKFRSDIIRWMDGCTRDGRAPNQVPDLVGAGRGAGRRSGRKDIVVGAASQDAAAGGGQQGADPPRNLMDNSDLPEPKRSGKKGNRRNKGYLPLDEYEIPPDEVCEVPCLGVGVSETMNGGSRTDSQNGGGFLYKLDDAGSTSAGGNVIGDGSSRPAKKEERRARQQKGGGYLTSCVDIAGTGVGVDVHLGKQTKMDGSKASLQKGGGDLIAREDTANGVVDPAVEALQKCERFEATVRLITQNIKRQHKIEDIPTVLLHWKPKWKDLVRYRDESIAIYLACCPFAISVKMKNGETKHFPASPAKPEQMEDATHHIIILRRPSDRAEVHLLIEQFSNYLKAFKIVLQGERKEQKRWLILGLRNKLPKRFDPTGNIQNDENYKEVENVTMHKEKFPEIFKFFVSFDVPHPEKRKATQEGRVILSASFVFFCEFIRYRIVGNWMLLGLSRDWNMPLRIPRNFPALLRDWSYLSKLVFALYLAILELPMLHALPEEEKKTCPFIETMPDARKDWKDRQQVQPAISFFFDNEKDMQLEWLCGEHIMLLRHEYASCDKILMRLIGYDGFWYREIQTAMEKKSQ